MLASTQSLIALLTIYLAALGIGQPVLRRLRLAEDDALETIVWSAAIGLVSSGTLLAGVGLCGWLYRPVIGCLTIAAALSAIGDLLAKPLLVGWGDLQGQTGTKSRPKIYFLRGMLFLAAVAMFASLLSALAPPTSGDALCYHLELPKIFLAEHGLVFLPYSDNATFPLLVEMWYLWALALDGAVAAQLVHWSMGLLLALATVLLAREILGRQSAWISGALVLLVPGVTNQMAAPLNDLALAAFTTLALVAWRRACGGGLLTRLPLPLGEDRGEDALEGGAFERGKPGVGRQLAIRPHPIPLPEGEGTGGRTGDWSWTVVAGLMFGGALAIKFTACLFIVAVSVAWCWEFWTHRGDRRKLVVSAGAAAMIAVSIAGLWYVRAAWHWGNPVYPFFSEYLGEPGPEVMPASKTPLAASLQSIVTAPWQITLHPEQFGGRGYQFGGLFLALTPGLLIVSRRREYSALLVIAIGYGALWYLLRQNLRFLLPVLPMLAIAAASVWLELLRFPRWPRLLCSVACVAIVLAQAAIPAARCREHLPVAIGLQSRDEYLAEAEPTFTIAQVANQLLPPDARLLSQEYRAFYFDCQVTRESIFRRREDYESQVGDSRNLSRVLRTAGFSHLLLAESKGSGIRYRGNLRRLADAAELGDDLHCLYEGRFADRDGAVRRYRLMELR